MGEKVDIVVKLYLLIKEIGMINQNMMIIYSLLENGYNNHLEYLDMVEVFGLVELSITYLM